MTDSPDVVRHAHDRLARAAREGAPCAPVRDLIGSDPTLAYAVQRLGIAARLADGSVVVGRKIGLTSPAVQAQLGVDQPDFGILLDTMAVPVGGTVPAGRLLQPRVEAELAFVLGADLTDPDPTLDQVRAAVDHAVAAIEIVDSRIAGWDITFADTVADNGSSGLFVLGDERLDLDGFSPVDVAMSLTIDGVEMSTGSGAACLGDPLLALTWLARVAVELGDPLLAGQVVLSGALGPMRDALPGTEVRATLRVAERLLDEVTVAFAPLDSGGSGGSGQSRDAGAAFPHPAGAPA